MTYIVGQEVIQRFDWTNAQITGWGAATAADLIVGYLSVASRVSGAWMTLRSISSGAATLRLSAGIITDVDMFTAEQNALNQPVGTILSGRAALPPWGAECDNMYFVVPSISADTTACVHIVVTGGTLGDVVGCSGSLYLRTQIIP